MLNTAPVADDNVTFAMEAGRNANGTHGSNPSDHVIPGTGNPGGHGEVTDTDKLDDPGASGFGDV